MSDKIKTVLIRATMKGNGVVNFDGDAQKEFLRNTFPQEFGPALSYTNAKVGKHNFYREDDGSVYRRLMISAACLRFHIFNNDMIAQNPVLMNDPEIFQDVLASAHSVLRGYMFTKDLTGIATLKRASPFCITSAEEISGSIGRMMTGGKSGRKTKDSIENIGEQEANKTSLFSTETAGNMEYALCASLDLHELPFISLAETYDRLAIFPDTVGSYRQKLGKKLKSEIPEEASYVSSFSEMKWPEKGILLTQDQTHLLATILIKKLMSTRIQKATAYAEMDEVHVKFLRDPIKDKMSDDTGWVKLNDDAHFASLFKPSDIEVKYEKVKSPELNRHNESVAKFTEYMNAKLKEEKKAKKDKKEKSAPNNAVAQQAG